MNLTFEKRRTCKRCGTPIPDQVHGAQEFCKPKQLADGSIENCRDDYHNARRTLSDQPYLQLMAFQKQMTGAITSLKLAKGEVVGVEDLNQYGIDLSRAVRLRIEEGQLSFYFMHHQIDKQQDFTFKIKDYVPVR